MRRAAAPVLPALLLMAVLWPSGATAGSFTQQSGRIQVRVDDTLAYPGGLFIVDAMSSRGIGGYADAVFDGRRCQLFPTRLGLRALVPVPPTLPPGSYTLGLSVRSGRYRRRMPIAVQVVGRQYPARSAVIPEVKRALLLEPRAVRDGRQVLLRLRTETPVRLWRGPFQPPVDAEPVYSYGAPMVYDGERTAAVESVTDSVWGEYHRGMDYTVPAGTVVQAPAAASVAMAADLPLTGRTLILDHGQGVLSVFFHLGRIDVAEGQLVEGRAPIALSGDSGIAAQPHVHWAVYVHGVAVDPRVMERLVE
jgi:hypothetical protein